MSQISLINSTGNDTIDDILVRVINAFENAFPNRIRAYHVTGSYYNRSAISNSDIDMTIIFKGDSIDEQEEEKCFQTGEYCDSLSSVELDFKYIDEGKLLPLDNEFPYTHYIIINKIGSLLIYGEDIRHKMPLPPIDVVAWTYMVGIYRERLLSKRRESSEVLTFPLRYPEPEDEFYGYGSGDNIFDLVLSVGLAVTIMCAIKAGKYVGSKSECPSIYAECINDKWTPFIQEVFEKCRYQWEQRVPTDEAERKQLREICRKTLAYENHFLSVYREYLLVKLRGSDGYSQILAAQWLGKIIYPDEEVVNALKSLENSDNRELQQVVKEALGQISASSP